MAPLQAISGVVFLFLKVLPIDMAQLTIGGAKDVRCS